MQIHRASILLTLSVGLITAFGQVDGPPSIDDFVIEEINLPGGRLGNNVNCIVQGPHGYMWFGSHGGLHRYDGNQFVTYRPEDSDTVSPTRSLTFPYIEWLHWTHDSTLWIATWGGGAYRFDPTSEIFTHYTADLHDPHQLSNSSVNVVAEDKDGTIWLGTNNGLNKFDPRDQTFEKFLHDPHDQSSIPHDYVTSMYLDHEGTFWIGSGFAYFLPNAGGLSRLNPDGKTFTNYKGGKQADELWSSAVRGIREDSKGNFWVGTSKALHRLDRSSGKFERMMTSDTMPFSPGMGERVDPAVYSILEDQDDGLWIGTIMDDGFYSHLLRHDLVSRQNLTFPFETSVWQTTQSRNGTIWIAGAGISGKCWTIEKRQRSAETILRNRAFYEDSYMNSLYGKIREERGKHLFLGAMDDILFDGVRNAVWIKFEIVTESEAQAHVLMAEHNLETHLVTWHEVDGRLQTGEVAGISEWYGHSIGMGLDADGRIWGGLNNADIGIFILDPKNGDVTFLQESLDDSGLPTNLITTVYVDKANNVWVGTDRHGLLRIDPSDFSVLQLPLYPTEYETQHNNTVLSICEDASGHVFAAGAIYARDDLPTIMKVNPRDNELDEIVMAHGYTFEVLENISVSPENGDIAVTLSSGPLGFLPHDSGAWEYYSANEGNFPITTLSNLVCDSEARFWTSNAQGQGLVTFKRPQEFQAIEMNRIDRSLSMRARSKTEEGHVMFLSQDGVEYLSNTDFASIDRENAKAILFTDLSISGKRVGFDEEGVLKRTRGHIEEIHLRHDLAQSFSVSISSLDYGKTSSHYQYRLLPQSQEWIQSSVPKITFYQLPAGSYDLEVVTASGGSGALPIEVTPPWWSSQGAFLIYGILASIALWLIYKTQKKRTIAREREKSREKELAQAKEIEKAYRQLKATQSQLIHSEKMASLGELTAGIAHEIQNPLNFVNNFAEVSSELVDEAIDELRNNDINETKVLLGDLKQNLGKINHHGSRASGIVKGMLDHSRKDAGERVPTDINTLCDEYVRLSYHGLRAKDKSFNAKTEVHLDPDIGKISIVPQEVGRVLLNLLNNAFYTVGKRAKTSQEGYQPTVVLETHQNGDSIFISIRDNGKGIGEDNLQKIFQPFFTTKPTGEGTGLGLSLSYDIIKAHDGNLSVESTLGHGTEFKIELPKISNQ